MGVDRSAMGHQPPLTNLKLARDKERKHCLRQIRTQFEMENETRVGCDRRVFFFPTGTMRNHSYFRKSIPSLMDTSLSGCVDTTKLGSGFFDATIDATYLLHDGLVITDFSKLEWIRTPGGCFATGERAGKY